MPAHHKAEEYLDAYIAAAGIADENNAPLFRTTRGKTRALTRQAMTRTDVFRMIQRRAADAGLSTAVCCHSFRATGITAYLENGGTLETRPADRRARIAAHHEALRPTGKQREPRRRYFITARRLIQIPREPLHASDGAFHKGHIEGWLSALVQFRLQDEQTDQCLALAGMHLDDQVFQCAALGEPFLQYRDLSRTQRAGITRPVPTVINLFRVNNFAVGLLPPSCSLKSTIPGL